MFHILEREIQWRRQNGRPEGFGAMHACRPVVAVGAEDPLEDQKMLADYFRMYSVYWELHCLGQGSFLIITPQMERMDSAVSMLVYGYLSIPQPYPIVYSCVKMSN